MSMLICYQQDSLCGQKPTERVALADLADTLLADIRLIGKPGIGGLRHRRIETKIDEEFWA
ncbi:hypothetical protein JP75_21035 [Devosia riboflavina]|uniref:Uncharacterized protein n=1 Tax=Devosia riboflavina TaxID=46914 RepID=A0A087LXT9_9HYPH|nr:hypothetical protein JP75_21035 [Devosia riboflavina]